MVAVFGESERSEPEMLVQRRLKLELNTAGDQQQFAGVTEEVPPEQPGQSISLNQEEVEHPYIKEEEEEAEITTVTVQREEVHLSRFDESPKEENGDERAAEAARTSGPEGQLGADQQQLLKTPSLEQEVAGSCDFEVKEEADFVVVTIEGNEEGAEFSQLHQSTTEDKEDCGGSGLARNSGHDGHLGPCSENESHSTETEDSDDWMTPFAPQHERIHTGEKPFSCSFCGKRFKRKREQNRHERIHTGERPFSCSQCDQRFTHQYILKGHEMIHTGEKPYCCSVCGKRFYRKHEQSSHERIHTGERPFSCSQCGKGFRTKSNLRAHEVIHTGKEPFSCSACGKKFKRKDNLRQHEKVHAGEKPFSCSQCDKRFAQKRDLKLHERIHTGEKSLSISECGERFTTKDN